MCEYAEREGKSNCWKMQVMHWIWKKKVQSVGRHHVNERLNKALLGRDSLESNKLKQVQQKLKYENPYLRNINHFLDEREVG